MCANMGGSPLPSTPRAPAKQANPEEHAPQQVGSSQNHGYHFEGPHNKDFNILGSILGSLYFGKLPGGPECYVKAQVLMLR